MADEQRTETATEQLIEKAAALSGQPAEELTPEKAIEIIYERDKDRIDQELDRRESETVPPEQQEGIDETAETLLQDAAQIGKDSTPKDPKLDPGSPAFDWNAWRHYVNEKDPNSAATGAADKMQKMLLSVVQSTLIAHDIAAEWDNILKGFTTFRETINAIKPVLEELEELTPYLEKEFAKPEYDGLTMADLMERETDSKGKPIKGTLWEKAFLAARMARDREQLPVSAVKRASKIDFPIDKVNAEVWSLLQENTHGQLKFALPVERRGSHKDINIIYSIDFDRLESSGARITKRLTEVDKRVYVAVAALFNAGNDIVSITQIHFAMGNTKNPAKNQLQKIRDSLEKMARAWVTIDNKQEIEAGYKYEKVSYAGNLMHVEMIDRHNVQGGIAESAVHILAEPALMKFARKRNQITTVPVKLLQSPVSKTEANLAIEGYLIERVAKAKNGTGQNKILYATVNEHAHITGKKQQERTPEKVKRYLDYYAQCGHIKKYTAAKDGVTLYF